jgi:hypothetical protein
MVKLNQAFYSSSFDKDIVITVGSYIQQHRQQFDKSITNNREQNAYDYFLMNEDRILQYYNYKYKVVDKIVVKDNEIIANSLSIKEKLKKTKKVMKEMLREWMFYSLYGKKRL